MAKSLDPLLSAEELSVMLRKPKATLYAWNYRGEGPPAIKIGRHLRYRREDVEKWLAEMQAQTGHRSEGTG